MVFNYSMKDKRWASAKLGGISSLITLGNDGCYITSISIIDGRTPFEINNILTQKKCFTADAELLNDAAAKALGYTYKFLATNPNTYPIICETNHYAKLGYPKHFFVMIDPANRLDPLDLMVKPEPNNYNIVSCRVWLKIKSA